MSGTHLFYNGVLLRDCELIDFGQVIERDEESDTDVKWSRFRITVASNCISLHSVNPEETLPEDLTPEQNPLDRQHLSTIAIPEVDGESLADRIQYIQNALQHPRKDFWFALNSTTHKPLAVNQPDSYTPASNPSQNDSYRVILAATGIDDYAPVAGDEESTGGRVVSGKISGAWMTDTEINREDVVDFNNGPKPQSVNVTKINGGRTMRVQFTIEICRPLCDYVPSEPSVHPIRDAHRVQGVISNRWSISETLNYNWETEIAIEGVLRVSDHRYKPDAMRLMTSCSLFPYARLESRTFATSADGLTLKYRYTLKEAGIAPPPGIVDWSGSYTERMSNGGICIGAIKVVVRGTHALPTSINDFDGNPITNHRSYKRYLTDWLFKIIETRLPSQRNAAGLPGVDSETLTPVDVTIVENMKEPQVEANVTVRHSNAAFEDFGLRLFNFGKDIYDAADPVLANWDSRDWPIPPAYTWEPRFTEKHRGSAYDCYFQSPCSQWHAKPEGWNREFEVVKRREEAEAAETKQYIYEGTSEINSDLAAAAIPPASTLPLSSGWSNLQTAGFSYLHVEIENDYPCNKGLLALPLSTQRDSNSGSVTGFAETVSFIQVHAGIQRRIFTMVATRQGDWPKVPIPNETINNSSLGIQERLLSSRVMPSHPTLNVDGKTYEYSVQVKWEYALSRPIELAADIFKAGSDPRDTSTPAGNAIKVTEFFDSTGSIELTST